MQEERESGDRPAESPRPPDDTQRMPDLGPEPEPAIPPPEAQPVEPPPDLGGETQRIPPPAISNPAPWAQEPPRPAASAPPQPGPGPETVAFSGMPGIPSPYKSPPPAPSPLTPAPPITAPYGPLPAPPPAAPPEPGYPPAFVPTPAAYAPPPVYGPAPGGYGSYTPAAMTAPVSGNAIGAMVCGILSIVFSCSAGPFGLILGGVALFLISQYNQQQRRAPQPVPNPSDATYIQAGRITAFIGMAIGLVYTLLIGCYLLVAIFAIIGGAASGTP